MEARGVKVTRGRITVPAQPNITRTFMFNPNDVDDNKETSYGSVEIPGASHPVVSFGAGGARDISFTLYIDGDRGRFGRSQARDVSSLSIMDELMWYRSLVYPAQYGMTAAAVFPYVVLFSMGPLYQRLPCVVMKAPWKITYWTPKMEPVRATIPLLLREIASKSQTSEDLWKLGGLR